jgi:hypothetical protein
MKKILLVTAIIAAIAATAFSQSKTVQCTAITKKGVQCKLHTSSENGLCHLHGGTAVKASAATTQCTAICKSTGAQCKHRTSNSNGKCFVHAAK